MLRVLGWVAIKVKLSPPDEAASDDSPEVSEALVEAVSLLSERVVPSE